MLAAAEHAYERWLHGTSAGALHDITAEALACAGALIDQPTRTQRRSP
jgi:hypothetical protein